MFDRDWLNYYYSNKKKTKKFSYRLEMYSESGSNKPELIFMDQIEDISSDFVHYKGEQCIQIRVNDGSRDGRIILTNSVRIRFG